MTPNTRSLAPLGLLSPSILTTQGAAETAGQMTYLSPLCPRNRLSKALDVGARIFLFVKHRRPQEALLCSQTEHFSPFSHSALPKGEERHSNWWDIGAKVILTADEEYLGILSLSLSGHLGSISSKHPNALTAVQHARFLYPLNVRC